MDTNLINETVSCKSYFDFDIVCWSFLALVHEYDYFCLSLCNSLCLTRAESLTLGSICRCFESEGHSVLVNQKQNKDKISNINRVDRKWGIPWEFTCFWLFSSNNSIFWRYTFLSNFKFSTDGINFPITFYLIRIDIGHIGIFILLS